MTHLEREDIFALTEDTRSPTYSARFYKNPIGCITANVADEVAPALDALEAQQRAGRHLCGYMRYECGYPLHNLPMPDHSSKYSDDAPLLHFYAFDGYQQLTRSDVDQLLAHLGGNDESAIYAARFNEAEASYLEKFTYIQALIRAGETYQINYTTPYSFCFAGPPAALYRKLRSEQCVAYATFLNFPECRVLSLSPELFLDRCGTTLTSRPMKGTAPRGNDAISDKQLAEQLQRDTKSQAENLMIVDLLRNDIGRVAEIGTVNVASLFEIETYETLYQMTSTVIGQVSRDTGLSRILQSLFPCGSITGAPKRHSMEIISSLEPAARGIYCGLIGYIEPHCDFRFSVAIRTIVTTQSGKAAMGVGSGIVHDSSAEAEYAEVQLKTRFLRVVNRDFRLLESMLYAPTSGVEALELHLARLAQAARCFDFRLDLAQLKTTISSFCARFIEPRRIRLQLAHDGSLSLTDLPIERARTTLLHILVSPYRIDSTSIFRRHKTTARQVYDSEYMRACKLGAYEIILLNEHGRVAEATRHNLFIHCGDTLITPPVCEGALPGILRAQLLADPTRRILEQPLDLDDLRKANGIFVGNCVRGLVKVELKE
ncbi:MAG: aminodeoxychorismate synthase, component I [Rhodocyclales bacterium RIFCSPLOWO2_02_FULL_63_24]|nr:MAG: aminodeoxychorismate synthase, component I [Rhodocyclales bacterium RIFCSPLOWO2_02_FULL_63_24]